MPMGEMAKDQEFPRKWMFGMAMMLKKGLHLNQIHNIDRSFEDMMLGLENWIPMYMTGQISPYYLKDVQGNVFLHFLKVSGSLALTGEAISGYHSEGNRYYILSAFRNIQICIHERKWVIVSKNKTPAIHFLIRHPKMRNAFENMVIPMIEK